MLLPGVAETIQFIDGSPDLPAAQAARRFNEPIGFGVPALTYAAVKIARLPAGEGAPLARRMAAILANGLTDDAAPHGDRPGFPLFSFRAEEIHIFVKLNDLIGDSFSPFEMQILSIAVTTPGLRLMLAANDRNRRLQDLPLLPSPIAWIYPGAGLPGA